MRSHVSVVRSAGAVAGYIRSYSRSLFAAAAVAIGAAAGGAAGAEFQGLGFLPGGSVSEAKGVSADGAVVVGSSQAADGKQQAFRWTLAGGIAPIPRPAGLTMSWASDVSADGSTVAGWAGNSFSSPIGWEGFRWSISGALDRIAVAGAGVWAKGISADGSVVAGSAGDEAFRWTAAGGIQPLGGLSPAPFRSNADGISADGRVIVGDALDVANVVRDAFRWADGTMVGLGAFTASAASRDGSVVVGAFNNGDHREAYRWTAGAGLVGLGAYAPYHESFALGVSADGSVVVGYIESSLDDSKRAFVWTAPGGMRPLQDLLADDPGLDLTGWSLTKAMDVSAEGLTIVGRAYDPAGNEQAFRAVLAEPAVAIMPGDVGRDGAVDFLDYLTVKGNFGMAAGATWADGDFDGDRDVDFIDYLAVKASFGASQAGAAIGPAAGGAGGSAPEPAGLALLLAAAAIVLRRSKGA